MQKAIKDGVLSVERLESYWKLEKEAKYDGLDSRLIEKEKIGDMFGSMADMKNFRKFIKQQNRKTRR